MIASRSPLVRQGVEAASPLALVVAAYLFFAGHNVPGGGFAAGLVLGAVLALRTIANLPTPISAVGALSLGVLIAAGDALLPIVLGDPVLDQKQLELSLPLLGDVKVGTALVFDAGVTLVVLGLVAAVLDGFGAGNLAGTDEPVRPDGAADVEGPRP